MSSGPLIIDLGPGQWRPSAIEQPTTRLRMRVAWASPDFDSEGDPSGWTWACGWRQYPDGHRAWARELVLADALDLAPGVAAPTTAEVAAWRS
jgi:hypothetical protein